MMFFFEIYEDCKERQNSHFVALFLFEKGDITYLMSKVTYQEKSEKIGSWSKIGRGIGGEKYGMQGGIGLEAYGIKRG